MHGHRVKADIIATGLELWREGGESKVSARGIGKRVGLTHSGVLYHWENSAAKLKRAIADEAVRLGDAAIVPRLILDNHPAVAHLDMAARQAYLSAAG